MSIDLALFIAIGFVAQLVDGALGMAFGVLSTTILMAFGVAPANASAMTHVAEVFTTAASGASHAYHRNVDWRLVARLAPAGMAGGAIGATLLASVDGDAVAPYVSAYLAAMGLYVALRALDGVRLREAWDRWVPAIGLSGGVLDAVGGGGWGAIVTGTLVGRGHAARMVIGSANLTEFLVSMTVSAAFVATIGWSEMRSAVGLVIGGVAAAPFGGYLVKKVPTRPLTLAVGLIIIATSLPRIF